MLRLDRKLFGLICTEASSELSYSERIRLVTLQPSRLGALDVVRQRFKIQRQKQE